MVGRSPENEPFSGNENLCEYSREEFFRLRLTKYETGFLSFGIKWGILVGELLIEPFGCPQAGSNPSLPPSRNIRISVCVRRRPTGANVAAVAGRRAAKAGADAG